MKISSLIDKFNLFFYNYFSKKVSIGNDVKKELELNDSNVAIDIRNLSMSYKRKGELTIKNCTFQVQKGDFHVFIGQNGAGKSTIIKMIIGWNCDFTGQILISGIDSKSKDARLNMMFVPDKPIFPSEFSTFDFLFLSSNEKEKQNKEELTKKIINYLDEFGITEIKDKNPNFLSSGQKQKVLIIKLLINKSKIIILDEPTSNLDSITRIQFLNKLKELSIKENVIIFISTHILDEIQKYATAATFIDKGKIKWNGKVKNNNILKIHNQIYNLINNEYN